MISNTTRMVDNKFYVDFNVQPQNITHKRQYSGQKAYTATHVGGGTTKRQGIKEGIEIKSIKTKVGEHAWRDRDISNTVTCWTAYNDNPIQISVTYTLKCMGWQWKDYTGTYPFFWYGNIGQVPHKYRHGSFKDSKPVAPGSEHTICAVPSDWKLVSTDWSDWAYKHGSSTKNYAIADGRFEQRNFNNDTSSETTATGWFSETGYSQFTRKSMMFTFEKTYTMTVYSSGIATHPNAPELTVQYAKGDLGNIVVKHTDPANKSANVQVNATCKGMNVEVVSYSNSGSIASGASKTFTIDFNKCFGESYRGNDIKYEAWSKNSLGYVSKTSSGIKGVHRYNGRPTVPTGLRIEGDSGIIYNKVNFYWNAATDPDKDTVVYDVWVRFTTKEGKVLKDDYIVRGLNKLTTSYDISNLPDECGIQVWVRSSDNSITSDWCQPVESKKGAVPKGSLALISPSVTGTNLYNKRPRFVFEGYDGSTEFIVVINNKEYSSVKNASLFSKHNNRIVFKPNFDLSSTISIYAYMKNQYGNSKASMTYKFTIKSPKEDVEENDIITAKVIKDIQLLIADFGKAFNKKFEYEAVNKETVLTAKIYNTCHNFLNSVLWNINDLTPGSPFEYALHCWPVEPGQLNDDELWNKLVEELNNI